MRDTILTDLGMDAAQSKNRLLLVDGDPKSLRVLDVSLKKAGFEVTTATSGREALALLEASQPDLIISDTDLDEMDGFELCSQIKAHTEWTKIPFLFVSGRKSIEDKIRGLELGVDDYLTKPIYIKEIGIRVRTALQRAERERMESRREGRTRFAGDLSDVGVVDLVQTIELNRKSGIIHIVNRDTRRGSIFFRDGKVIDAEVGRLSGANAIYRLFSWSEGQFAVEFKQIRRHDVIDTPMAPLLMEGMRRLDESAHILEGLPPTSNVLEVDCRALAEELAELPDEVNSVLRLCDGTRTLVEVVEDSDHPDLEALTFINKLFTSQIIFARETPDRGGEAEPSERLAHWLSEGGAEDGAAAEDASASAEFAATQVPASDSDVIPEGTPPPTRAAAQALEALVPAPADALTFEAEFLPTSDPKDSALVLPKTPGPDADPSDDSLPTISASAVAPRPEMDLSAEESLGAVLPPQAETITETSNEFATPSDTLRGVPVDNLFGEHESKSEPSPPPVPPADVNPVLAPMESRPTKPLGLAERLLSDDSALRASAMHEAIDETAGKVEGPLSNERNTREYGDPAAEAAAALVQEVVSSAHELKRENPSPAQPERPTKEVDWGAWPTGIPALAHPLEPALAIQPTSEAVPVEPQKSADPSSEPALVQPPLPTIDQAASEVVVSPKLEEPPPLLAAEQPVIGPPGMLAAGTDVPPEADNSCTHEATFSPDGDSLIAGAKLAVEAFRNRSDESPSPPPSPRPSPKATTSRSARKTIPARHIWLMAGAAFTLGVIGYLAFGAKTLPPSKLQLSPAHSAAEPPSSTQAAAALAAEGKPLVAPTAGGKPDKAPERLGLGTPSAMVNDLRRKCLETDAGGKGKAKAVSSACRPALEAEPKDVEIMVILARTEIDRGRLGEARSLARKAMATDPQRLDAYVYLGTAEQEAGRIDEARAAYKKYLELAPDGPFARELRAILNNL
jgi:CheY-like chemotaxis protein